MAGEFRQTDFTSAPDTDASEYKSQIDENFGVHNEIAGQFAPHAASTPDMTVVVDAGRFMYGGTLVVQPQQTTAAIVAPTTDPRVDRVVIDDVTGAAEVVQGTEDPAPVAPAIPAGKRPCAVIGDHPSFRLLPGATAITNSMIDDERSEVHPLEITPAFAATLSSDHTGLSAFPLPFDNEIFDITNDYNTSTARFQPSVPGIYCVSFIIYIVNPASNGSQNAGIRKTGSYVVRASEYLSTGLGRFITARCLVECNGTTDYIEVVKTSGVSSTTSSTSGYSRFEAHRVQALPSP